ncbi:MULTISPECIES: hypothetical protein [unclassified Nostoc]|nr:hypothetical protein [Nostoc sp. S13]MDF5738702.1 hypothetical protein [Nostoc sp. S13]
MSYVGHFLYEVERRRGDRGEGSREKAGEQGRNNQCPMPNAQCPMPHN